MFRGAPCARRFFRLRLRQGFPAESSCWKGASLGHCRLPGAAFRPSAMSGTSADRPHPLQLGKLRVLTYSGLQIHVPAVLAGAGIGS